MKSNFYSILPAFVRYSQTLKPMEKILYSEITALMDQNGFCEARNCYFAELYGVSEETISRWINNLKKTGFLAIRLMYDKEKLTSKRYIFLPGLTEKDFDDLIKVHSTTDVSVEDFDEKIKLNNISINKDTKNKPSITRKTPKKIPPTFSDEFEKWFADFWKNYPHRRGQKIGYTETKTFLSKQSKSMLSDIKKALYNFNNSPDTLAGFGIPDPIRFVRTSRVKEAKYLSFLNVSTPTEQNEVDKQFENEGFNF